MRKWAALYLGTLLVASCESVEGPTMFVDTPGPPYPSMRHINGDGTDAGTDSSPADVIGDPSGQALWAPASAQQPLPPGAFPAGADQAATLYVCRVHYAGGVHSGQVAPLGPCSFGWGGKEVTSITYEVLTGTGFVWRPAAAPLGDIPGNAVLSGMDDVPLYVCRAAYMGGVHPGKLYKGDCNISVSGLEVVLATYDILLTTSVARQPDLPGSHIQGASDGT